MGRCYACVGSCVLVLCSGGSCVLVFCSGESCVLVLCSVGSCGTVGLWDIHRAHNMLFAPASCLVAVLPKFQQSPLQSPLQTVMFVCKSRAQSNCQCCRATCQGHVRQSLGSRHRKLALALEVALGIKVPLVFPLLDCWPVLEGAGFSVPIPLVPCNLAILAHRYLPLFVGGPGSASSRARRAPTTGAGALVEAMAGASTAGAMVEALGGVGAGAVVGAGFLMNAAQKPPLDLSCIP